MLVMVALVLSLAACGSGNGGDDRKQAGSDVDTLVSDYGYQWTDTSAPILNDQGASEISSSWMKIMALK